jgi:hypothetical protein
MEDVGTFYGHLVYFVTFWYIFGNLVYFYSFGIFHREKSGKPGLPRLSLKKCKANVSETSEAFVCKTCKSMT